MRTLAHAWRRGLQQRAGSQLPELPRGLLGGVRGTAEAAAAAPVDPTGRNGSAAALAETEMRPTTLREFAVYDWDLERYKTFRVDISSCGPMLLDVLLKAKREQDPSLHVPHLCRQGRCGACNSFVNGKSMLPCSVRVDPDVTSVSTVKSVMPPFVAVKEEDCW